MRSQRLRRQNVPDDKHDSPALRDIPDNFEPDVLFETFNRHNVEYIVVGGLAAVVHGAEVNTRDLDLVVEQSKANLDRVADALQELQARRITDGGMHDSVGGQAPSNAYEITNRVEMFRTPAGRVDIMREALVIGGYQDIGPRAQAYLIRGQEVFVADLDTVIRAKEAASRPKDRIHLEALYDLRSVLTDAAEQQPQLDRQHSTEHQPGRDLDTATASIGRAAEKIAQVDRTRRDEPPAVTEYAQEPSYDIDHDR